jgi:uncharacterized membrane protein
MMRFVRKSHLAIIILLFIIAGIFAYIALVSHNHFETFGWDLGFFDQIIWKVSRGDLRAVSTIAHETLLGDHFQVVLYFLAPLYWLVRDVRTILVVQAFLVVAAAFPLYLVSLRETKNYFFSVAVIIAYLLFTGTQWTILNEFHQMAFAPLFLSIVFYSLIRKKYIGYWLGIVGLLITKEELGLLVSAIGFVAWWKFSLKKTGLITIIAGAVSFFLLIYFVMPKLSLNGTYSHFDFGAAGFTPVDVIKKSFTNPLFLIQSLIYPPVKIKTVITSFSAFGFLPLFSPILLIPPFEQFISRFIYAGPQFTKWVNVNHHAAPLGILLGVGSIYAAVFIVKIISEKSAVNKKNIYTILGLYLLAIGFAHDFLQHGPINSIFKKQLYSTSVWMQDDQEAILHMPANVPVAAQNSLVPHLSQRNEIYLLPEIGNAEYIMVDMHDGPNKYSPLTYKQMQELIIKLQADYQFAPFYRKNDVLILKKL